MEVSSFLYFTACLCACVCLYVLVYLCVCVPLCVHSIWPLNCSLNRIRRLCFLPTTSTNTRSLSLSCTLSLMHSLSLSLTGCFPRVLVKQLLLPCLLLSMHSSTFTSCQRQRSWGNLLAAPSSTCPISSPATCCYFCCCLLTGPIYYAPCLPYTFAAAAAALVAHISLSSLFILPPFSILIQRAAHAAFPLLIRLLLLLLLLLCLRCWRVCPCACFGTRCPPPRLSACRLSPPSPPPPPSCTRILRSELPLFVDIL